VSVLLSLFQFKSNVLAKMRFVLLLAALVASIELTPDNWDSATAGKSVFIKFQAPW